MPVQIIPFHNGLLTQAAELLARRHTNDRVALPGLPAHFEDTQVARKAIEATLNHKKVSGFAALVDDRLVAYLIGNIVIDSQWGHAAWIHSPGCAYTDDFGIEFIRDLYACLGETCVQAGIFYHAILIPITDETLVHAWFSLSFGIEQIHALLNLESFQPTEHESTRRFEIRRAEEGDRQRLAEISDAIWATHVKAPVWGTMLPEAVGETREGWAGLVDEDNEHRHFTCCYRSSIPGRATPRIRYCICGWRREWMGIGCYPNRKYAWSLGCWRTGRQN